MSIACYQNVYISNFQQWKKICHSLGKKCTYFKLWVPISYYRTYAMEIRTPTLGKKLNINLQWLPMVFDVMLGNFPCLVLRRFLGVKINENSPEINFTDYIAFYDHSLKVGPIINKRFTITFAHSYLQVFAMIYLVWIGVGAKGTYTSRNPLHMWEQRWYSPNYIKKVVAWKKISPLLNKKQILIAKGFLKRAKSWLLL